MVIFLDTIKSKELLTMIGGQSLIFISNAMRGGVDWIITTIAAILGLIVVVYSIINAKKKNEILEIEKMKLTEELKGAKLENEILEQKKK